MAHLLFGPYRSATYKALVISDGPIAYWPMNDSSTQFVDVRPNPANAVPSGALTFSATNILDPLLPAPYFPGNQYADFSIGTTPNKFTFASTDTVTFEGWISTLSGQPDGDLIALNRNYDFCISVLVSQNEFGIIYNNTNIAFVPMTNSTYQYVACVIGPAGCKFYLNGNLVYTNTNGWGGCTGGGVLAIGGQTNTFNDYTTGFISNVAVYKKELPQSKIQHHFAVGGGIDYFQYLKSTNPTALWMLDDLSGPTAVDSSSSGSYNGTYEGAYLAFNQAPARNLYPNLGMSNGSYIQAGYHTTTNPLTFSYGIWFTTPYSGMIMGFQDAIAAGSETNWDRCLYVSSSGQLGFGTINGSTVTVLQGGPDVRNTTDWHYAVVTYQDNGNGTCSGNLYLDGYPVASNNAMIPASSYSSSGNYYLTIGYNQAGTTWQSVASGWASIPNYYQGSMCAVEYYENTILTQSEILNSFILGSTNTGWDSLQLTFKTDGTDSSAFNNSPTVSGSPTFGHPGPITNSYACLFNENQYIGYPTSLPLEPQFDFTLDFYVNFTSLPTSSQLCTWWEQQPTPALNVYYDGGVYTTKNIVVSDNNFNYIQYPWQPNTSQWYHIQVERRNAIVYLFIDSALRQANPCSAAFANKPLYIGGRPDLSSNGSMLGYISNFQYTNGQALINPTGAVSDTVTLLHFDNNLTDSSLYHLVYTNVGSPTFSTNSPFSGSYNSLVTSQGNYISNSGDSALQFGQNSFTVEMWINFSALPNSGQLAMLFEQNVANGLGWYFDGGLYNPANSLVVSNNLSNYIVHSWTPSPNTWYSVAVVRDVINGQLRLYIGGVQVASISLSPSVIFALGQTSIGGHPALPSNGALNGNIAEVRVTNGQALYTGNYTPATMPFPNP